MNVDESDWRRLRDLKPELLNRLCDRILSDCEAIRNKPDLSAHARFLELFDCVQKGNDDIALCFDDLKRSNALQKMLAMYTRGLITADELASFSPQRQDSLAMLRGAARSATRETRSR